MSKYYKEIDDAIKSYEEYKPYHTRKTEWICNRIEWCWKWRKITQSQMEELCDRIIKVLERRD